MKLNVIKIKGARQNNLKNIDINLPKNKLVAITGLSGSGKSTLAFDTIYAEGQRKYVESMSSYARQFLEKLKKPKVDFIEGLSPSIAIKQKQSTHNPRSTVGTVTEIHDFLRLLFAKAGSIYCHKCGEKIISKSFDEVVNKIIAKPKNSRFMVLAPIKLAHKTNPKKQKKLFQQLQNDGFTKIIINKKIIDLETSCSRINNNNTDQIYIIIDRLIVKKNIRNRLADSMELALAKAGGKVKIIFMENNSEKIINSINFNETPTCTKCSVEYPKVSPATFSFNSPYGACEKCSGIGKISEFSPLKIVVNENLSLSEGAISLWANIKTPNFIDFIDTFASFYNCDIHTPYSSLPNAFKKALMYGILKINKKKIAYLKKKFEQLFKKKFEGIIPILKQDYKKVKDNHSKKKLRQYMSKVLCSECKGSRLKQSSRFIKINNLSISNLTRLSISDIQKFFNNYNPQGKTKKITDRIVKEIKTRLLFLEKVGLSYLTLDRPAHTLSSGESQRIRLASQIGSKLTGVLYVLDEPSIGLHQRDNEQLINALIKMRNIGNSVIVVEHDKDIIMSCDYVVDMGPGAGINGGDIVFEGTPKQMLKDHKSLTGKYFSNRIKINKPKKQNKTNYGKIRIEQASKNNLKNISVNFPLGTFICVTGVSGSGKSTLVIDTLYPTVKYYLNKLKMPSGLCSNISGLEKINKIVNIDQSPIGKTIRSNPATYTGFLSHIRELLSKTHEAKLRGYSPGRFSFNIKNGRCEKCKGDGTLKVEMHFLPDVHVICDICNGERYNQETLKIKYKGKNISQILNMTVNEALYFFRNVRKIRTILETLASTGLDYLKIGQSSLTLSGGESQRIRLARELSKSSTGKTLYILDEPTTGLHNDDIQKLLLILNKLVDHGNTVIVIEHNLEIIKIADYIIDLGPDGGKNGGEIIGEGTPKDLCSINNSYTGQYLKKTLLNETREGVSERIDNHPN